MIKTTKSIACPECFVRPGDYCIDTTNGRLKYSEHSARAWLSINEAIKKGISRLRKPAWSNYCDHLQLTLLRGGLDQSIKIYSPFNRTYHARDPVIILADLYKNSFDCFEFEIYRGPLPGAFEYINEEKRISEGRIRP